MLLTFNNVDFIDVKKKHKTYVSGSNSSVTKQKISDLILCEVNHNLDVFDFIQKHVDICLETTFVTSTAEKFNIQKLTEIHYASLINLKKINDIRFINKFFETVNAKLPNSGIYIGVVATHPNRKKAIIEKYPAVLNRLIYTADYIFTRVLPKLSLTKRLYFYLTKGKGRVLSRAETYGRLYACGFEVLEEKSINNLLYFAVKKVKDPVFDCDPSYGALISLKRIGKHGHKFNVLKFRTMHPYSEYLQEYVYKQNMLQKGGKIKNDFRISPEGRVLRKFWIDEIPMFINILRGDMKLVGVRPLSAHFFSLIGSE